jgi:hypothetical protein
MDEPQENSPAAVPRSVVASDDFRSFRLRRNTAVFFLVVSLFGIYAGAVQWRFEYELHTTPSPQLVLLSALGMLGIVAIEFLLLYLIRVPAYFIATLVPAVCYRPGIPMWVELVACVGATLAGGLIGGLMRLCQTGHWPARRGIFDCFPPPSIGRRAAKETRAIAAGKSERLCSLVIAEPSEYRR